MEKILIIDDDPDIITLLQTLLKKEGYEVAAATRESEVYEQVEAFHPHLIVMDVLLAGVDGREICKKLKATEKLHHVPVVICSGHPGAQKNLEYFNADEFLPKPFDSAQFLNCIEMHLAKRNAGQRQKITAS
jgi:CheY-like chemotaxis protein